ncbi:hypothetical protein EHW58_09725 [Salinivibrio sp. VYel1]|nr:hypothetical protein [Salinivibrio sp. VYel1]
MNSVEAYRGIRDGNGEQAGSALGDLGGSLAGAALDSVVPGIGTAIGGLVGGIAGGLGGQEIGAWLGRKLDPPEVTAEKIKEVERKKAEAAQKPPMHFAPQINIESSPNQNSEEIAEIAMRKMEEKYAYATSGNDVTTQLGYSGIDQD